MVHASIVAPTADAVVRTRRAARMPQPTEPRSATTAALAHATTVVGTQIARSMRLRSDRRVRPVPRRRT